MLKFIGFFFVGLAVIGIFLPILPTTPFLLVALYCFAKSSPKWQKWLVENPVLGRYLRVYTDKEGLSVAQKMRAIVMMWIVMGVTIVFFANPVWLKITLAVIGMCVTIHLATIKGKDDTK